MNIMDSHDIDENANQAFEFDVPEDKKDDDFQNLQDKSQESNKEIERKTPEL